MKALKAYLVALVVSWSALALADDGERQLSISVGDWPPFFVESEPGQGTVARLVRDIFAAEGYAVKFHFLPWKRAYREAANGRHDATAIWMYTADRQKDFLYSDPVMNERFVLFYRKDTPIEWNQMQDLADLTLGGSIGYSYGPEFDNAIKDGTLSVELKKLRTEGFWQGDVWSKRKNGEVFSGRMKVAVHRALNGKIKDYVAFFSDITELRKSEERLAGTS